MSEIIDRRQRALETYHDEYLICSGGTGTSRAEAAIEVATQVKITDDIYEAFVEGTRYAKFRDGVKAAFRAAGFEVVE